MYFHILDNVHLDDDRPISSVLGNEAEELRRKQLAIEQEVMY